MGGVHKLFVILNYDSERVRNRTPLAICNCASMPWSSSPELKTFRISSFPDTHTVAV